MPTGDIPGFTAEQRWALQQVVKEGVREGVSEALKDPRCPRPCENVHELQSVVFGAPETEVVGLSERMRSVEKSLGYAAKALWIAIGALIVAFVGIAVE